MVAIRVLPPEVVNRIAAGEVIERPASVVKELLENSIDSGAKNITIQIEDGGKKRIRIRDDGCGIAPEDLPLAFESHATSKLPLDDAADPQERGLFTVATLGFRGEALASIAAVADVEVTSRAAGAECAHVFRPSGAGRSAALPEPAAAPPGTTIEVRNLFAALPARRKFLRSPGTEFSHIVDQVMRLALGFPRIGFRLEHGGRKALDFPPARDLRERIAAALGAIEPADLLEVSSPEPAGSPGAAGKFRLRGFVGGPRVARADARGQNFFVNGRWVRDRVLAHALRDAFQGFQIPGRNPVAYLYLDLPPNQLDINVHPQKLEVRFLDSQSIHRWLYHAVRGALESRGHPALPPQPDGRGAPGARDSGDLFTDAAAAGLEKERIRQALGDFFQDASPRADFDLRAGSWRGPASGGAPAASGAPGSGQAAGPVPGPGRRMEADPQAARPAPGAPRAFQVLREFILVEAADGLVVIDQHALHEKVLYERILRRLEDKSFPTQRLLFPEVVALPAELAPWIPEIIEQLRVFGFELEPFGECEVAVQSVPVILDRGPAGAVVREVAEWLHGHPEQNEDGAAGVVAGRLRRIAQMMACKQAVKAGMDLTPEEIQALLEESRRARDPRFCPHGRPASIAISRAELEKRFDRK